MEKLQNFIDGDYVAPIDNRYIDNYDPSRGQIYAQTPDSTERDVKIAVDSARKAFPIWANTPAQKRGEILLKIANEIEKNFDLFVQAETKDSGKPLWLAKQIDIPRSIANFKFFGSAIQQFSSQSHYMEQLGLNYTLRSPIGIVGCISPWNLPLYLFSWKIAPALAAGNCVIAKPSEITPYTAFLLGKITKDAGLPNGVLSILHGTGQSVGEAIVKHPDIKAISFTGGTKTGANIAKIASPMFKKLSLELGGKNPTIIFKDCDFEHTLNTTIRSSFTNQGQICLCGSRILIERPIYEKFKNAFVEKVKSLIVSYPTNVQAKLGAITSQQHLQKILSYIELSKEEGGNILTGGKRINLNFPYDKGYYVEPTVIENLSNSCRTNREEIFGPIVTIAPFDSENEALKIANDTNYGLSATIFTTELEKAHRVAEKLDVGIVWINEWLIRDLRTPFGGVKDSGLGREGGWDALNFFTESKNIFVKISKTTQ